MIGREQTPQPISLDVVAETVRRYSAIHRYIKPRYQTAMLRSLQDVWRGPYERVLDVGGGTGTIAQCLADHFAIGRVTTIDIADRFHPDLSVEYRVYDGKVIPFADRAFDAVTMNNVLHHVPRSHRGTLLREIVRVSDGPLYIKDHLSLGALDNARLSVLDFIGNVPFGGMVQAEYLPMTEWRKLADDAGYRIVEMRSGEYRTGPYALLFPNRLETTMRWERS